MLRTVTESQVFRALLIARGLAANTSGPTPAWGVTTVAMPANGDSFLTVYDTSPVQHGRLAKTGKRTQHYGVSLRIRCPKTSNSVGALKGKAIEKDLEQVQNQTITVEGKSVKVHTVQQIGGVNQVGQEEQNLRFLFTMNFLFAATEAGEGAEV